MNIPAEMTVITISTPGGPEVLLPRLAPVPQPAPGEVLIRVAAAGVNFPDLLQRQGKYDPPHGHSPLPGLEVSGIVAALGAEVAGLAIGDAVVALCNGGGYAEFVAVPAGQVLPLPAGVDLISGAALPETFFTIEQTLVMRAGLEPGMTVLIHGAAGGIGGAAILISRALGAEPIAVVSTPEKAAYVRELGAEMIIDHTTEDFVTGTLALTDRKGADRVVNIAGGDMLARNIAASARFGAIVQLAGLGGDKAEISISQFMGRALTLIGSTLRPQSSATKAAIAQSLKDKIWPAFAQGRIGLPRIRTFPLEAAADAHRAMEQRENFGKIVLVTAFGRANNADKPIAHA
ncbi:MAG TPA: NAD(P)H-quinone oxidoreductase [Arsenicitalea sp.]|jgi:NADPH2:quinone reductase|nr:NAD(P)H-quinone oxidoreductase [Arsenicitalea sp.]